MVALILVLCSLLSATGGSARAAAMRDRAVGDTTSSLASFGTAEWTSDATPDMLVPAKARADLGTFHVTTSWAIADNTHFRTQATTSSPPLLAQTSIEWANGGTTMISYRSTDGTAMRLPLPAASGPSEARILMSGGALPATGTTIASYLAQYNRAGSGVRARVMGQETYLGRLADVIEVRPVYRASGSSCAADAHGKQRCRSVTHSYGTQRIWVDDAHPVVLQTVVRGVPARYGGNRAYRVTSITFDQQPSPSQLAFTSPVPVTDPPNGNESTGSTGTLQGGGKAGWQAPDGFISAGRPLGPSGAAYVLSGSGQGSGPGGNGVVSAAAIFARNHKPLKNHTSNFVLIQEQIRKNGPPPLFAGGTAVPAGTCTAVTGSFPDGIHWLGFSRGSVSVLVSSDRLSEGKLARYVATRVCR